MKSLAIEIVRSMGKKKKPADPFQSEDNTEDTESEDMDPEQELMSDFVDAVSSEDKEGALEALKELLSILK